MPASWPMVRAFACKA